MHDVIDPRNNNNNKQSLRYLWLCLKRPNLLRKYYCKLKIGNTKSNQSIKCLCQSENSLTKIDDLNKLEQQKKEEEEDDDSFKTKCFTD